MRSSRRFQHTLETCDEHLSAVTRLSHGLDEIASFLQLQVVLRPERLDLVEVARAAITELKTNAPIRATWTSPSTERSTCWARGIGCA